MIKVYFETSNGSMADLIAIFDDEETYQVCFDALDAYAKKLDLIMTESVDEETDISSIDERSNE